MNLPTIISNLFDTAARRRAQLATLEGKVAELNADYERAIAAGNDDEADKVAAKLLRAQAEAGAARKAIETADRQARARESDAARIEQQRKEQVYADAWAAYEREAVRFEELVTGDVLAQWRLVEAQFEAARVAAADARVPRGSTVPGHVWAHVFTRLLQSTQEDGKGQMVMPPGRSPSRAMETLSERFARKEEPRPVLEEDTAER